MSVHASVHPAGLPHAPALQRPPGPPPRAPAVPPRAGASNPGVDFFRADTGLSLSLALDDLADAAELGHEADLADAALLRCVAWVAFATLVLALVSSLPLS